MFDATIAKIKARWFGGEPYISSRMEGASLSIEAVNKHMRVAYLGAPDVHVTYQLSIQPIDNTENIKLGYLGTHPDITSSITKRYREDHTICAIPEGNRYLGFELVGKYEATPQEDEDSFYGVLVTYLNGKGKKETFFTSLDILPKNA